MKYRVAPSNSIKPRVAPSNLFGGGLAGKTSFIRNISLLFGENNYKSFGQRKRLKNKTLPDKG